MLGAQVPLCNTSAFASNISTVNCDVSPDGQRFVSEFSSERCLGDGAVSGHRA